MAARSVNKVILVGHLGRDAESASTPSGVSRATFSVATNRRWKDQQTGDWKEETEWHRVVLWRSENVVPYLTRGTQVYVEGRLSSRSYDDKDGNKRYVTEVVAEDVILLGGRSGGDPGGAPREEYSQQAPPPARRPQPMPQRQAGPAPEPGFDSGVTDDDVPF